MRIDHFEEWKKEIHDYCIRMNLDFEKLKKMSKGNGFDFLIFAYNDPKKESNGLLDDTPAPVVLIVRKATDSLIFETTEYTDLFLKKIS